MDELKKDEFGVYHSKTREQNPKICHANLIRRLRDLSFKIDDKLDLEGYKDKQYSIIKNKYGNWIAKNMGSTETDYVLCCCGFQISNYHIIVSPTSKAACCIGSECIKKFFGDATFSLLNDELKEIKKSSKIKHERQMKKAKREFKKSIVLLKYLVKHNKWPLKPTEFSTKRIVTDWYNSKKGLLDLSEFEYKLVKLYTKFLRISKLI